LIYTIQQTIAPETWYDEGGDGRLDQYGESKLIIWQTPEVHKQIKDFLALIREGLGQQVAIEARFLLVDENFLEDIGVDADFLRLNTGINKLGNKGIISIQQDSAAQVTALPSGTAPALGINTSYGGPLDDLQVSLIIRATQQHRNSKTLTAPKATVMNGESATVLVLTNKRYVSDTELVTDTTTTDGVSNTYAYWDTTLDTIQTGVTMSITPTITADKKYVLLRISAYLNDLLADGAGQGSAVGIIPGVGTVSNSFDLPTTQLTSIQTRVSVPDRGTVLLGGQTLTAQTELEAGAPILSKLPILGRLFSNRSKTSDKKILLILVKPTIMLQEETEQDAIGAMSRP